MQAGGKTIGQQTRGHGHSVSNSMLPAPSWHILLWLPPCANPTLPTVLCTPALPSCALPPSRPSPAPLQWQNRSYMRAEMTLHKALTEVDKAYGRDHPMFSRCLLQVAGMAITQVWKE